MPRYLIVLDRYDDDDYAADDIAGGHDGSDAAAIAQVARELQEAMDTTGLPVGFFCVVARLDATPPNVGSRDEITTDQVRAVIRALERC